MLIKKKKWDCVESFTFVSVSTPESDTSCHSSQPLLCSNNSIKGEGTPGTISSFYFCFSYFRRLLILIFIPFSFPRLSNFGNHRLDFLSPYSSFMTSVQFLGSILSKPPPPITAVLIPFIYCHCWRSPLMFLVLHTLIICSRCFMLFHFVVDESVKERSNPGESIESIVDVKVSKIINKHIYRWRFIQILSIQCKNIIPKD